MKTICALAVLWMAMGSGAWAISPGDFLGTFSGESAQDGEKLACSVTVEKKKGKYVVSGGYGYESGKSPAPDFDGTGVLSRDGVLEFTFTDSFENEGTGMMYLTKGVPNLTLRIKTLKDPRCVPLYQPMALKKQK